MQELNKNNSRNDHYDVAHRERDEYITQIEKMTADILNDDDIDINTLHQLDRQLDHEWEEDGFSKDKVDFASSVVDADGRLIKIMAIGQKQPSLLLDGTLPPSLARVFIAGDQRDVEIPSIFRSPDLNLRNGSLQNNSLYKANDEHMAKIMSLLAGRSDVSDEMLTIMSNQIDQSKSNENFQWMVNQLGDHVSALHGNDTLRTSDANTKNLQVAGIGFESLINGKMTAEAWEMHNQATQASSKVKKKLFESATSIEFRQLAAFRESMNDQSESK